MAVGRLLRVLAGLWAGVAGVSTIEFAIIAPVMCTLTVGLIDFGMGMWHQMQVSGAARAGAEYVELHGFDSNSIQTVITNATSYGAITATPAPASICGCSDATAGVTAVSCGSSCTSGSGPHRYVSVGAQASYSMIVPWPGISNPITLSATAIARLYP
jgi:Flp pilus assembly protein TadG